MKNGDNAPRLLLAADSLRDASHAPRDRVIEVSARYRDPASLAVVLAKALDAGAEGVLAAPAQMWRTAARDLRRPVPMHAVVPAISELEHDALDPGVDGLRVRAREAASPLGRWRSSMHGLFHPIAARRGDSEIRVLETVELQLAFHRPKPLEGVVLHAAITDLALAGGHAPLFDRWVRWVRRRYHAAAGLETRHPGMLLSRLREWGIAPDYVVAPFNPSGFGMKPTPAETIAEVRDSGIPLVARELRAGGVHALPEAAAWALSHGAAGLAPDLAEMDDVGLELRKLAAR